MPGKGLFAGTSEVLDPVFHFFGRAARAEEKKRLQEPAHAVLVLVAVRDAGMFNAGCRMP